MVGQLKWRMENYVITFPGIKYINISGSSSCGDGDAGGDCRDINDTNVIYSKH